MNSQVLIVDDEPAIRQMLQFTLSAEGFRCHEAGSAVEAAGALAAQAPALILLDWMLPGVSGLDYARRLKRDPRTQGIPIIMLTARDAEADKIRGLDSGADDYVTKPFSTLELLARVRAVLRRSTPTGTGETMEVAGLKLDPETRRVTVRGVNLNLSPTEFRLLHFFISHPERVFTRNQLLDQVWGDHVYIEERTVDVHIRRLRKVLSGHGYDCLIQTVRSVGYRLSTQ
ncbi:MAG: Phosphate regulon transcriptional regulatory protein PhoB [Gammaproteobacteria bacterium]|nr:Phosphate regulon transcriptional regulatory protein PhoB [Gammaproteobacteria bacterium]